MKGLIEFVPNFIGQRVVVAIRDWNGERSHFVIREKSNFSDDRK